MKPEKWVNPCDLNSPLYILSYGFACAPAGGPVVEYKPKTELKCRNKTQLLSKRGELRPPLPLPRRAAG